MLPAGVVEVESKSRRDNYSYLVQSTGRKYESERKACGAAADSPMSSDARAALLESRARASANARREHEMKMASIALLEGVVPVASKSRPVEFAYFVKSTGKKYSTMELV